MIKIKVLYAAIFLLFIIMIFALIISFKGKTKKSTLKACFKSDVKTVWEIVTDNKNYKWRGDLDSVEIIDENTFIEYTKECYKTEFVIIEKEEYKKYSFDIKNSNMLGKWEGVFRETEDGETEIVFTEEVEIQSPIMRIAAFFFFDLKRIQRKYVEDLRKRIESV